MTVIVECPHCHRALARLEWIGDRAMVAATVTPDNDDPRGRVHVHSPTRSIRAAAYVVDVDPANAGRGASSTKGRKKLVCNRRGHRNPKPSRVVTQEALDASMRRFIAAGIDRVTWLDLHA